MKTTPKITRTAIKAYSIMDWPCLFIVLLSLNKVYSRKARCASGKHWCEKIRIMLYSYYESVKILSMDYKKLFDQYLLFVNRLIPKPAAPPVIGIDIGTSSIKAVELGQSARGLEIRHWAIEPLAGNDTKSALKKIGERLHFNDQHSGFARFLVKGP